MSVPLARKPGTGARPSPPRQYDVYLKDCPARLVFDRLADKWSLLLVGRLRRGPIRFNQLRREIEGVSQKVLSQTLRKLERDGLVARQAFPTVPVTVEYSLTALGRTLSEAIEPLSVWAQTSIEAVVAAQQRYDAACARKDRAPLDAGPEAAGNHPSNEGPVLPG